MAHRLHLMPARVIASDLPQSLPSLILADQPNTGNSIRICAIGDVVFCNGVAETGRLHGYDSLFEEVSGFLRSSDAVFANLECALSDQTAPLGQLVGASAAISGLQSAGITVVNLANNHVYDAGPKGLRDTLRTVRGAGLLPLGAGDSRRAARELVVTEREGRKIGWLGCARTLQGQSESGPLFWEYNEAELLETICESRSKVDCLFVSLHIGYEYIEVPSPEHRRLAHRCVESGANVILMHHAHVLQGTERVGDHAVVCYNLGNFLMDPCCGHVQVQTVLRQRCSGAVFVFDIMPEGACQMSILPIYMDGQYRARWAVGDRGREILSRLLQMTDFLGSEAAVAKEFSRQRAERNLAPVFQVLSHHLVRGNWRIVMKFLAAIRLRHFGTLIRMLGLRMLKYRLS